MSRVKKLAVPSGNSSVIYDIAVDYSNIDNSPSIPEDLEDLTDWASTSDVTVSSVTYHTYWKIAPTSTNDVYGWAFHPTNGLLYYIRSNKGTLSANTYSADTNTKVRLYKDETGTYPIIGSRTAASSVTSGSTGVYGEISGTKAITMTPSTGTITATTFSGKATSAGNADTVNNLTVETAVPANAKFTDTTYESKTAASGGTDVSLVTTGEKYTWNNKGSYSKPSDGIPKTDLASAVQTSLGKADTALQSYTETDPVFSASAASGIKSTDITNWNGKTSNTGTVTSVSVKMNGASKGTVTSSGTIDLGTVITSHQDISGKIDNTETGLSGAINKLSEGTSPAVRNDYIVAQYVNGGTTTTSYHRKKLSNIFAALNKSDITKALGYTPPTTDNDTKNTAGSTDTSSKIYLVGATSQAANPQTYSDNEVYTTSGVLTTKSVQVGGGSATIQYNATTGCMEVIC